MERVLSGLAYPVGLVAAPDGGMCVGEGGSGKVVRVQDDGTRAVVAEVPGAPMGLAWTAGGDLLIADNGGKFPPAPSTGGEAGADEASPSVYRVAADGAMSTIVDGFGDVGLSAPNGICVDDAGGFWFADSPWDFRDESGARGCLGYLAADGTPAQLTTSLRFPAVVALDAAGERLFVSESMDGGIWTFDVVAPGELGEPSLFAALGPDVLPSGIALDADGRVLVCGHQSGCVHVFGPAGDELDGIDIGRTCGLAHLTFGGSDRQTLLIAASATGEILATPWTSPGLPLRG